jgi:membrane protease YdiL (CAAX protease family)
MVLKGPLNKAGNPRVRAGLILLFLAAGFLVFFVFFHGALVLGIMRNLHLGFNQKVAVVRGIQVTVTLSSLTASLVFRKNIRLSPYWRLAFAYFVVSSALLLSDFTGDWALISSGQPLNTPKGFAALKLGEDAAIIGTIIVLVLLTRDDPEQSFLSRGRLGLGLIIGIPSFLGFTVLGIASTLAKGIEPDRVRELLPAFLLIVLADGFMEEMLFRGLFLRRLRHFIGDNWANVVMAAVFALMHLGVLFTGSLPMFLMIVFLLGLLWGWIMQRTGSVLAPALFHAGVDMLIIADAFAAFGIRG